MNNQRHSNRNTNAHPNNTESLQVSYNGLFEAPARKRNHFKRRIALSNLLQPLHTRSTGSARIRVFCLSVPKKRHPLRLRCRPRPHIQRHKRRWSFTHRYRCMCRSWRGNGREPRCIRFIIQFSHKQHSHHLKVFPPQTRIRSNGRSNGIPLRTERTRWHRHLHIDTAIISRSFILWFLYCQHCQYRLPCLSEPESGHFTHGIIDCFLLKILFPRSQLVDRAQNGFIVDIHHRNGGVCFL